MIKLCSSAEEQLSVLLLYCNIHVFQVHLARVYNTTIKCTVAGVCQESAVCVCVCVFIKLHITAQSGPVILAILCHSH